MERVKSIEPTSASQPISVETGGFLHISTSTKPRAFWPERRFTSFSRSVFVMRNHAGSCRRSQQETHIRLRIATLAEESIHREQRLPSQIAPAGQRGYHFHREHH